jgi:SAM-dependent methyltransferase
MGEVPEFTFSEERALTGERTLPGIPEENYWFQRHVAAYRFAASRVAGLRVLDAGCGEGYGSQILASAAAEVLGVDLDRSIVRRAASRYARPAFEPADVLSLPYPNVSFGAVISLQVIEHLAQPHEFLGEVARVLEPGGLLILSTPNRLTFSRDGIRNPFHTFEFSPDDLRRALDGPLEVAFLAGVSHGWRVRTFELLTRMPLPERLLSRPAPEWPGWLRTAVSRIIPSDFRIRRSELERSLDLIAVARRRA